MKFRLKITFCMICLLSLLFSIGSSALISISFENSLEREKQAAQESYNLLLGMLQVVDEITALPGGCDVSGLLEQLSSQSGAAWSSLRLSSPAEVLYVKGDTADLFADVSLQTDDGHGAVTMLRDPEGARYLQLSSSFMVGRDPLFLDVAYDVSPIYSARAWQQAVFHRIFLAMVAVCALLSYGISWYLTRPMARLSRASREIAAGNFAYRARVRTKDELGRLTEEFNGMADRVEDSFVGMQESVKRQEQFVGSFTHELKTPLTSIIGYADLLRSQTLTAAEQAEVANYIFSEGKRLERLSLQLLDIYVAGRQAIKLTPVSPAKLIGELVRNLQPDFGRQGISLHCECEEGVCLLDADLTRSLLVNLLDNARKAVADREGGGKAAADRSGGDKAASDPGGRGKAAMDGAAGSNGGSGAAGIGRVEVYCRMTGEGCRIYVRDNGRGIPESALAHLTEAFYRVDRSRSRAQGGAGLGLALCAKIAELHGGAIRFESREGVGTMAVAELKGGRL